LLAFGADEMQLTVWLQEQTITITRKAVTRALKLFVKLFVNFFHFFDYDVGKLGRQWVAFDTSIDNTGIDNTEFFGQSLDTIAKDFDLAFSILQD
jgi:xylose isomerase